MADSVFEKVFGPSFGSMSDPNVGTPMAPNVDLPSQGKVTSMFVDQPLLDALPRSQAEEVASRARNTFLFGLLSGDIGRAFTNAQATGYNSLEQSMRFQTHQRALAQKQAYDALVQKYMIPAQGTPGDPNYKPGGFDDKGFYSDPALRKVLSPEQALQLRPKWNIAPGGIPYLENNPDVRGAPFPDRRVINDTVVDVNDPNAPKTIPKLETGQRINPQGQVEFVPGFLDRQKELTAQTEAIKQLYNLQPGEEVLFDSAGRPVGVRNRDGAIKALEERKVAEEGAKAQFNLVDVDMGDGSTVKMTASQLADAAKKGFPYKNVKSPTVGANQQLYTDPKTGEIKTRLIPGATNAIAQQTGAEVGTRARIEAQNRTSPVQLPDGTTVLMTDAQAIDAAKTGKPFVQNIGPQAQAERQGAGRFNIEQVLTPAKTAADAARSANTSLSVLKSTLDRTPVNAFTQLATVQQIAGYAKALGVLDERAAANVSDLKALNGLVSSAVLQEQLAQKGPQTESDARRMTETVNAMGDKEATQFLIATKMAQNKRTQEYYAHLDKYRRENGTLDGADQAWGVGKGKESIFRDPGMKKYAPIYEKDGKRYRVYNDGGAPELVK